MNDYSFENFIMQCCKAKEWDLRKFLKKVLIRAGFRIQEDDFRSHRGGKYSSIRNMLAIRGNPRVCLVAHTDVCRDHAYGSPEVDPVIKVEEIRDELRAIIQDRNCSVQVGGDDRLGVAINTWIAINTGYDMGLLFTTDEEIGVVSAEYVKFPELLDFDILLQVDRGNHSDQLVTSIGGWQLCSDKTTRKLLKIAEDINLPRYQVNGMLTDVLAIKMNYMCNDAVNMTCGYHNSIGAEKDEYIDIQEAKDTMKYVSSIIKHYYLDEDKNDPEEQEDNKNEKKEIDFDIEDDISTIPANDTQRGRSKRKCKVRGSNDLWSEESYERDKRGSSYLDDDGRGGWMNYMG